ncbi:MAG TPA: TM2 domain-containing protein [Ignavibacteriales bacterium]|nr:TM2 domain-containing protein [Ignavibacteriales bacterium]
MSNILQIMPNLEGEEMAFVQNLIKDMSDDEARQFASIYGVRRRDPVLILLLALLGFICVAGVHRFVIDHIGMGILYLLTGGLCLIGTIVDLVNYKRLAFEYNSKIAMQVAGMMKAAH